jgi:3-hydroxybutyryl-CoA dehydrogenase
VPESNEESQNAEDLFPRVGVIGCGTMGSGIAQVIAQSGRPVVLLEADDEQLARGLERVMRFLEAGIQRGKVSEETRDSILRRIRGTTEIRDLAQVDLVIEAISESRSIKTTLWHAVSEVVSSDTVLTTNTSALSVTDLAASVPDPSRFAGLHFFNPAPLLELVEVVRALQTRATVVADLLAFCEDLGKKPVEVEDRPGFLVNRLLMPFLNDVIQAYDDGLADAAGIDTAIELGLGHKIGPLRLLDMIGLDVHYHATLSAYEQTLDPAFAPPPLLAQMVRAGYYGEKRGIGFRSGRGVDGSAEAEP